MIPLKISRDCKNEVSIELNESQEEPAEELDQWNDTDRDSGTKKDLEEQRLLMKTLWDYMKTKKIGFDNVSKTKVFTPYS